MTRTMLFQANVRETDRGGRGGPRSRSPSTPIRTKPRRPAELIWGAANSEDIAVPPERGRNVTKVSTYRTRTNPEQPEATLKPGMMVDDTEAPRPAPGPRLF